MFSYKKLLVWQKASSLNFATYKITELFPQHEIHGLTNQIRRASVSIASNIAQGNGRANEAEKAHFMSIAYDSLLELSCQLQLACDLKYFSLEDLEHLNLRLGELGRMLATLRNKHLE